MTKKQWQNLVKEIEAGEYDAWAEELALGIHSTEIDMPTILSIVKDFANCRIIEAEDEA